MRDVWAEIEPFFTFTAHLPPRETRMMSPRQIAAHLDWWAEHHRQTHQQ